MTDGPANTLPARTFPTGALTFHFTFIEGSTQRWKHQIEALPGARSRRSGQGGITYEALTATTGRTVRVSQALVATIIRSDLPTRNRL